MRAVLLALPCAKGDLTSNLQHHLAALADAQELRADLAVFPEFSLTGSVDPARHPDDAVTLDHPAVTALVAATTSVAAVFGVAERLADGFAITQVAAADGRVVAVQRKRRLGEGEEGYQPGTATAVFTIAGRRCGLVICAEAGVDHTWDDCASAGAEVILFCSAPGLYGRRRDDDGWRAGLAWWESCGLTDARRHAARLGVPVLMATQSGSAHDEDFPGLAARVSASGEVLDRTPDWRPGRLVVDVAP